LWAFLIPSFFGSRYFITFIDDYNRKTWVQFLKKNFDALFAFKTLKNELEKETRKIIKIIRSDNGGE
jgi:hypothetical protein